MYAFPQIKFSEKAIKVSAMQSIGWIIFIDRNILSAGCRGGWPAGWRFLRIPTAGVHRHLHHPWLGLRTDARHLPLQDHHPPPEGDDQGDVGQTEGVPPEVHGRVRLRTVCPNLLSALTPGEVINSSVDHYLMQYDSSLVTIYNTPDKYLSLTLVINMINIIEHFQWAGSITREVVKIYDRPEVIQREINQLFSGQVSS